MEELKRIEYGKFKHPFIPILDTIRRNDQYYRQRFESVRKKYGKSSNEFIQLVNKMRNVDSDNINKLRKIIKDNGWLGKEEVGINRSRTFFLVLQHADIDIKKEFRNIF